MVGTSKAKNDDGGFDIFITTAPIPDLNEKLTIFGRIVKGEDVVQVTKNSNSFLFVMNLFFFFFHFCRLTCNSSGITLTPSRLSYYAFELFVCIKV